MRNDDSPLSVGAARAAVLGLAQTVGNLALFAAAARVVATALALPSLGGQGLDRSSLGGTSLLPISLVIGLAIVGKALAAWLFRAGLPRRSEAERAGLRRGAFLALVAERRSSRTAEEAAEAASLLVDGIESLELYRGLHAPQLLVGMTAPLVVAGAVALYDPVCALVLLAFAPFTPLAVGALRSAFRRVTERYFDETTRLTATFQEGLLGLSTLKLFGRGKAYGTRITDEAEGHRVATMRLLAVNQLLILVLDLTTSLGSVVAGAVAAALRYRAGALSASGALFVVLASVELARPLQLVGAYFFAGSIGRTALAKARAVIAGTPVKKTAVGDASTVATAKVRTSRELRLEEVSYSYPGASGGIGPVSMRLERGRLVGLRGPSGSGKTTLRRLLSGLAVPASGRVLVDGEDYSVRGPELAALVAVADQHPYLFAGTVRDNLALAAPGAGDGELRRALARVGLATLATRLDADIGEDGRLLSGGQRARLSLARALLLDRPFLLLDEPSAELDEDAERLVIDLAREESSRRGVLLVSHRTAPLRACDEVYALREGKVVHEHALDA